MDITPVTVVQLGCVVVAVVGLMALVLAMIRFEQRRPGAVAVLLLGSALVLTSAGVVAWAA
ncbi:hypothetical protein [Amnibacterium kyonggiense]|uniref:Uncharacterized protein n=1 Tax=Amnibacterium kyonggiense TaxID=595671 RepID=A0A4R7FP30_9MICO|nr:hypothetical protein [Amnibacterium kyonggiense]TDS79480.1 hypothetical protein CLV52_0009 [Amnibacterium kyonggiense]